MKRSSYRIHIPEVVPDTDAARVFVLFLMPTLARAMNEGAGVSIQPAPADFPAWLAQLTPAQVGLLEKLNRADVKNLGKQSALVVPKEWETGAGAMDDLAYSPLAHEWRAADAPPAKAVYVDLAIQAFGAYENGILVHWGPISSGAQVSATQAGSFHLNWRAKSHASTVNEEWLLPWYFNYNNFGGNAFHQYELPGRPASHGCVRLLERDAKWLYHWGETWTLSADGREVESAGTPVVIHGAYAYRDNPPWRQLKNWLQPVAPPPFPALLRPAA